MADARVPVTVVIPAMNEGHQIDECVRHLDWADEVIVVDGGSADGTAALAQAAGATVLDGHGVTIASQRNIAIARARNAWVLALDADERVTPDLHARIARIVADDAAGRPVADGYALPRKNMFWGRWVRHGGLYPDYQLRLFRRRAGRFLADAVHESVRVEGRVERLDEALLHHSYRSLEDFVQRSNRYSTLAAGEWLRRGKRAGLADLIFRPLGRFLSMYIIQRGFLDGWRGFVLAVLYADYVFLRMAKAWEARLAQDERH